MYYALILYVVVVNVITFIMYGLDKRKAIKHEWRIPEATLMTMAAIGGAIGALLAMKSFRHKTKHLKFTIGVPAILIIHICLLAVLVKSLLI